MEDSQNNQAVESQSPASYESRESSGVSFPTVGQPRRSSGVKTALIIGVLILVAVLGFLIYKSAGTEDGEPTPSPTDFDNLTTPAAGVAIPTITASPTASPSAKIDKSKVAIQIQNGTGITGEAAYLQNQLSPLGYTNIKVGNSDSNVSATSVTFSSSLDSGVVSEITQKLNGLYQTVNTKTSSTGTFDIVIVTGLRKGATPKASGTASPKASASPSGSPKSSASPTPSPSKSPVAQ